MLHLFFLYHILSLFVTIFCLIFSFLLLFIDINVLRLGLFVKDHFCVLSLWMQGQFAVRGSSFLEGFNVHFCKEITRTEIQPPHI